MKNIIVAQFCVLLAGTLFAWGNFIYELYLWLLARACETGCPAFGNNPFATACFFGALFFTAALVMSAMMLKNR